MPHQTLKLIPGVDQNRTPTLNEAAISTTNLVRFVPDKQGQIALIQKLGGWTKYFSNTVGSIVRALWAWEDTNANTYLGLGQEGTGVDGNGLSVIYNGSRAVITPRTDTFNYLLPTASPIVIPVISASESSGIATIVFDGDYIFHTGETVTLSGFTPGAYNGTQTILATPAPTRSSFCFNITSGTGNATVVGTLSYSSQNGIITRAGDSSVDVNAYGSNVTNYDTVYIKTQIAVDGLVLFGTYNCTFLSGDQFRITSIDATGSPLPATSTVVSPGGGAVPTYTLTNTQSQIIVTLANHGYLVGDTFPAVVSTIAGGVTIYGNYNVASVVSTSQFTIIAGYTASTAPTITATWSGGVARVVYSGDYVFNLGDTVVVSGVSPSGYNTASTGSTVVDAADQVLVTNAVWSSGTATLTFSGDRTFQVGETIYVASVSPSGYNGTYTVTAKTDTTVSYALASNPGTFVSIGLIRGYVAYAVAVNPGAYTADGTVFSLVARMNGGEAKYEFYRTPAPLPLGVGYGIGGYGAGGYGTGVIPPATVQGTPITTIDWTLDNWGSIFMACPINGEIYTWAPGTGAVVASVISGAPTVNDGMFVAMPQRQVVAWGSTYSGIQDPLLVRWSDVNDYTQWISSITNQAGSYRIPRGSKIVGAIQGPQQGLLWTDIALWAMQYVGPPYVYQFNEIGTGCGMIARKGAASMNGVVYWMGQSQFFKLSGSGVEIIKCPVWDVIFQDLDRNYLYKIRAAANSRFGEIAWYYPTTNSNGEITKYVKYNVYLDQWDFGTLTRTAWINESVLGAPIGAGISSGSNYVYQHETSPDADGLPMASTFQTGYFAMQEGEMKVFVDQVWPDMKWGYYGGDQTAHVLMTFYVADYPTDTPRVYGPYTLTNTTQYITPRFRGRLMAINLQSSPTEVGTFWRIGGIRYRVEQDGKF